jgi:spermidine/putrescine transport system substrate-binding protein
MSPADGLPPDLLRGLTTPRLSRRRFLQAAGLTSLGGVLAACGIPGTASGGGGMYGQTDAIERFWKRQKKTGTLDFANWPAYIDVAKGGDHPSLDLFTKQTGIKVSYSEDIDDDDSFYGSKLEPELKSGQPTGYDLMVITNGIFLDDLVQRNWLIPLDQSAMQNFYSYSSDLVRDPSYDRGNVYTMAWQSGITGIGYDIKLVGHEITSWDDLKDPKLKGKIGMFADTEDLPNSALCAVGVNPEVSQPADWKKAAQWLTEQRPLVRKYYQQDYLQPLAQGELYASQAWSGDVFQKLEVNPNLRFVVPKEGAPIWTDNMCIPKLASHPRDAMIYMDWVYQPKIAAMIADYVNYLTPVPATQQIFAKEAAQATDKADKKYYTYLSHSPLVFPTQSEFAKLHRYRVLSTQAEQDQWNSLFEPIYES